MNKIKIHILTFLFLSFASNTFCQNYFKGHTCDVLCSSPLENACIHNITTGMATFSNENGNFIIYVKEYDTLIITHVGYYVESIIITDSLKRSKNRCKVQMSQKSILLKEYTLYALKPYPIFLEDIASDAINEKPITLSDMEKADAAVKGKNPSVITSHPISFLYETFSRKARMNKLYSYLIEHEAETMLIEQKFNSKIVSQLTGLKSEDLEKFMVYCGFSYFTLIKNNENEIKNMILQKYKNYCKNNE